LKNRFEEEITAYSEQSKVNLTIILEEQNKKQQNIAIMNKFKQILITFFQLIATLSIFTQANGTNIST